MAVNSVIDVIASEAKQSFDSLQNNRKSRKRYINKIGGEIILCF